jgi:hypothetical protein
MEAKTFLESVFKQDVASACKIMDADPSVLNKIAFVSISCHGGYGLPAWKHICNYIREHRAEMRTVTFEIASRAPNVNLFLHFGIRGLYEEHLREAMRRGFNMTDKWMDAFAANEEVSRFLQTKIRPFKQVRTFDLPEELEQFILCFL